MEKNIDAHNRDVQTLGHYAYTDPNLLSARLSTTTIQDHMEEVIRKYVGVDVSILDVGCGDGTFTFDLFKRLKKATITAVEPAAEAVRAAQKKFARKNLSFKVGDAYAIQFKTNQFDLLLIRSVLHHLYDPQKALSNLASTAPYCLIVEPNGYSPALKIIEKISPYHRAHEERSFFPHTVRSWMADLGFTLLENRYINLVPTFAPNWVARTAKTLEPAVEALPLVKHLMCAQNITLWRKIGHN